MQVVRQGYRGLSFLLWLNADRLLMLGTVVAALVASAFLASALMQP